MEDIKGIRYAGEYDLVEINLFTSSGNVINLMAAYQSLNIYENMFSNSLSGTLLFIDTNNLVMNAPIVGQEFLSFKIKTASITEGGTSIIDFTKKLC